MSAIGWKADIKLDRLAAWRDDVIVINPDQASPEAWAEMLGAELPITLHQTLSGYRAERHTTGCSGAAVFRLTASHRPPLFLKTEQEGSFAELPEEAARLRWLASRNMPCTTVLSFSCERARWWLLMSAVLGRDLSSSPDLSPLGIIDTAAVALRALHSLDVRLCPYDHRLHRMMAEAGRRLEAGVVRENEFDAQWEGYRAAALFDELLARRPASEDLVVAHGDPCLPNILSDCGIFTGFVDCGRLGVSDRHRDLALVTRSIGSNLGPACVATFFQRYGFEPNSERLTFYRLLDEFF